MCLLIPRANPLIDDLAVVIRESESEDDPEETFLVEVRDRGSSLFLSGGSSLGTLSLKSFVQSSSSVGGVRDVGDL